jgi:hypothetical protein
LIFHQHAKLPISDKPDVLMGGIKPVEGGVVQRQVGENYPRSVSLI